jgi:serine/threonine-protein phosphatase 2A regulatory subunit B''
MEVEAARRDASALDPELLQLPELAPGALRENSTIDEEKYTQ